LIGVRNCIKIGYTTQVKCIGLIQMCQAFFILQIVCFVLYARISKKCDSCDLEE